MKFWVENITNRFLQTPELFEPLNLLKWLQWVPREGNLNFFLSYIGKKKVKLFKYEEVSPGCRT